MSTAAAIAHRALAGLQADDPYLYLEYDSAETAIDIRVHAKTGGEGVYIDKNDDGSETLYDTPTVSGGAVIPDYYDIAMTGRTGSKFVVKVLIDEFQGIEIKSQGLTGAFPSEEFNKATLDIYRLDINEPFTTFGNLTGRINQCVIQGLNSGTLDLSEATLISLSDAAGTGSARGELVLANPLNTATVGPQVESTLPADGNLNSYSINESGTHDITPSDFSSVVGSLAFLNGIYIGNSAITANSDAAINLPPDGYSTAASGGFRQRYYGTQGIVDFSLYDGAAAQMVCQVGASTAQMDTMLAAINANETGWPDPGSGSLIMAGNNAVPTGGASNTDALDIAAKGYSVTVNT